MERSDRRGLAALVAGMLVLSLMAVGRSAASAERALGYPDAERIAAGGPVSVSLAVSQQLFDDDEAGAVILARKDKFPDAMAASGLSGLLDAPILFTAPEQLDNGVMDEIMRVLPTPDPQANPPVQPSVYLLGGHAALSQDIEDELDAAGYLTPRFGGQGRVETAALAARTFEQENIDTAIVVRSHGMPDNTQGWVDSVSCGGVAANRSIPVLLTNPYDPNLHPATEATLDRLDVSNVIICGGTAAVPAQHEEDLKVRGYNVTRYSGRDRVDTALDVAKRLWGQDTPDGGQFVLVPGFGANYAFGLAAAPLSARHDAPILLVDADEPTGCDAGQRTSNTLCYLGTGGAVDHLFFTGDDTIISDEVVRAAAEAGKLEVDTTAPARPKGIEVIDTPEDDGTYVTVSWEAVTDESEVEYDVYFRPASEAETQTDTQDDGTQTDTQSDSTQTDTQSGSTQTDTQSDGVDPSYTRAVEGPTSDTTLVVRLCEPDEEGNRPCVGVDYQVGVVARDAVGNESGLSATITIATTDEIPAAPESEPNAQPASGARTQLNWIPAPEADAVGYVLERGDAVQEPPVFGSTTCSPSVESVSYTVIAEIDDVLTVSYLDQTSDKVGDQVCYRYRVVDTSGNQSDPSPVNGPYEIRSP